MAECAAMLLLGRRAVLCAIPGALCLLSTRPAAATLCRGLKLPELVAASTRGAIVMPLAAECRWAEIGGQRMIVTETRVRVDELLTERDSGGSEVLVRTLGGHVGKLGERVEGQAALRLGERSVLFLSAGEGVEYVTGMAQGHYPLREDQWGTLRLFASRNLPKLLEPEGSAVMTLSGRDVPAARTLIRGVER